MSNSLASHVVISSQVNTCLVIPMSFEGYLSTQAHQTGLKNKLQEKQTSEPLAIIHRWMVSSMV